MPMSNGTFSSDEIRTVEDLFEDLRNGIGYYTLRPHRLTGVCVMDVLSMGGGFIRWRNYGSSASAATVEDLAWILEHIFHESPEGFARRFYRLTREQLAAMV